MTSGIEVRLDPGEMHLGATVGMLRQIENLTKGRRDRHGCDPSVGWQVHIEGALGEMAFAKWSQRYWSGALGNLDADDVGAVQIRTTARHSSRLYLSREDSDDKPFVLVTGVAPTFVLRGWLWAREGKLAEYWCAPANDGRFNFFVPQAKLRPMPEQPAFRRAKQAAA